MKEKWNEFKTFVIALKKHPIVSFILLALVVLSIAIYNTQVSTWALVVQLLGMVIIAGLVLADFLDESKESVTIIVIRVLITAVLWYISARLLYERNAEKTIDIVKLLGAFEFIFLGCYIPDLLSRVQKDKELKALNKRIEIIEEKMGIKESSKAISEDSTNNTESK